MADNIVLVIRDTNFASVAVTRDGVLKCSCCNLSSNCPTIHLVKTCIADRDLAGDLLVFKELFEREPTVVYKLDRVAVSTQRVTFTQVRLVVVYVVALLYWILPQPVRHM